MHFFSTSAEQQWWWMWLWKLCIYILYNHNSVTLTPVLKKKKKKTHLDPSNYSWCKNTFLSLIKRKKTDYYHSTRGPKCNPLLRTVCRYIFNKHKCFCASMFFSHKVWNKYLLIHRERQWVSSFSGLNLENNQSN